MPNDTIYHIMIKSMLVIITAAAITDQWAMISCYTVDDNKLCVPADIGSSTVVAIFIGGHQFRF